VSRSAACAALLALLAAFPAAAKVMVTNVRIDSGPECVAVSGSLLDLILQNNCAGDIALTYVAFGTQEGAALKRGLPLDIAVEAAGGERTFTLSGEGRACDPLQDAPDAYGTCAMLALPAGASARFSPPRWIFRGNLPPYPTWFSIALRDQQGATELKGFFTGLRPMGEAP
jgi:hypothetical protein